MANDFPDEEMAEFILASNSPYDVKELGNNKVKAHVDDKI